MDTEGHPTKPKGRVVVQEVVGEGQAQRLGLQIGDIITAYNQMPITSACEFIVLTKVPGDVPRKLVVERTGQSLTFHVQPGMVGVRITEVARTALQPKE